tara:strand:- start:293 stop:1090 length:798 start_codon:yes stop_codon:yes gene_type:complete
MKVNAEYEATEGDIFNYNLTDTKINDVCGFRNFDGKQKDIVCIGAAQTLGRFVHYDYPILIQNNSNYSVANLGWGGVGIHQYNTQDFIEYINNAKLLICQITSGRSTPNLHKNFNIDNCLIRDIPTQIDELYKNDYNKFIECFEKNSIDYLRDSQSFRNKIKIPVIYIYVSPCDISVRTVPSKYTKWNPLIYSFPHLITHKMVKQLVGNDKLGCFVQPKFFKLPSKPNNYKAVIQHSDVFFTNQYYPDQETHYDIAEFCIKNINI